MGEALVVFAICYGTPHPETNEIRERDKIRMKIAGEVLKNRVVCNPKDVVVFTSPKPVGLSSAKIISEICGFDRLETDIELGADFIAWHFVFHDSLSRSAKEARYVVFVLEKEALIKLVSIFDGISTIHIESGDVYRFDSGKKIVEKVL